MMWDVLMMLNEKDEDIRSNLDGLLNCLECALYWVLIIY